MAQDTIRSEAPDQGSFILQVRDVRDRLDQLVESVGLTRTSNQKRAIATERRVRRFQSLWRKRNEAFGTSLFCDPGWEILVELYIGHLSGKADFISGIAFAAGVPQTTALRYIGLFEADGLIVREADRTDGRRQHLRLSPPALLSMEAYFDQLVQLTLD